LALHIAVAASNRLYGVLAVDAPGGVGDGGTQAFEAAMMARTPEANLARAQMLDERALRGEGTADEAAEGFALVWPAYFADPATAPPRPLIDVSTPAYAGGYESMMHELPRLEASLTKISVPVGCVVGGKSPIPA